MSEECLANNAMPVLDEADQQIERLRADLYSSAVFAEGEEFEINFEI